MAKYRGKSVRLNKPSRITKGQPGYGRKKFKVFVKSGNKVKKVMFGDPNMRIKKSSPARNHSEQDINVPQLKIKQQQDIGLARNGRRLNGNSTNILYT